VLIYSGQRSTVCPASPNGLPSAVKARAIGPAAGVLEIDLAWHDQGPRSIELLVDPKQLPELL
jgi:hypothetical protein